jgi:hypothetical protein
MQIKPALAGFIHLVHQKVRSVRSGHASHGLRAARRTVPPRMRALAHGSDSMR